MQPEKARRTRMKVEVVIFDLDGTLIDSSVSILEAYQAAFDHVGCKLMRPLTDSIIGPPLDETLSTLTGGADPVTREALVSAFKAHYDDLGFKKTSVFDGILQLLDETKAKGVPMYIATNKRIAPTLSIISYLGWSKYFSGVFALDSFATRLCNKGQLISRVLATEGLNPASTLYVGDREEDALAAEQAHVRFEKALWGYGINTVGSDIGDSRLLIEHFKSRLQLLTGYCGEGLFDTNG